jgi:hypothetical protein
MRSGLRVDREKRAANSITASAHQVRAPWRRTIERAIGDNDELLSLSSFHADFHAATSGLDRRDSPDGSNLFMVGAANFIFRADCPEMTSPCNGATRIV